LVPLGCPRNILQATHVGGRRRSTFPQREQPWLNPINEYSRAERRLPPSVVGF
jgi:hypothetical protein